MELIFAIIALVCLLIISITIPVIFLLEMFGWMWTGVPFVPVPNNALKKLPETISLTKDSVFYDLGCGDGRVLYELAKHSDARFIGVEIAPFPYVLAVVRGWFAGKKNVRIVYGDMTKVPLADATHVYTYLMTRVMDILLPKLKSELKPGAVLVSCDFKFNDREPKTTIDLGGGGMGHSLYVYDF